MLLVSPMFGSFELWKFLSLIFFSFCVLQTGNLILGSLIFADSGYVHISGPFKLLDSPLTGRTQNSTLHLILLMYIIKYCLLLYYLGSSLSWSNSMKGFSTFNCTASHLPFTRRFLKAVVAEWGIMAFFCIGNSSSHIKGTNKTPLKDGKYLYKAGFNYERACKYVKLLAITYPVGWNVSI